MKFYVGVNFIGHDTSIFYFDSNNFNFFAINTERLTRFKHDGTFIEESLGELVRNLDLDKDSEFVFCESYRNEPQFTAKYLARQDFTKSLRSYLKFKYIGDEISFRKKILPYKIYTIIKKIPRSRFVELLNILFSVFNVVFSRESFGERNGLKVRQRLKDYFSAKINKDKFNKLNYKLYFHDHHLCHAASAYYFSPFDECLSMTLDDSGDNYFSRVYKCQDSKMTEIASMNLFASTKKGMSIGRIYSIITERLGFIPNSDEGKVEALAAYGNYINSFYNFLRDNTYIIDGVIGFTKELENIYEENFLINWISQFKKEDIAAAVQRYTEDVVVESINQLIEKHPSTRIALSGGVFANVILNLAIIERTKIKELYVFPAFADDGASAGALILQLINDFGVEIARKIKSYVTSNPMPYWGPSCNKQDVIKDLETFEDCIVFRELGNGWPEYVASLLTAGKIGAIFHGRMEYGPRALGNRSIIADVRNKDAIAIINSKIKGRPWFQPFCPSILEEERERLFEKSYPNKHMTVAFRMKSQFISILPSAVHVDGTARAQFVEEIDNHNYYRLLKKVKDITGYGVVLNTSFNKHGRTIARTVSDAVTDFLDSGMDYLCIEGVLVEPKKKGLS